MQITEEEIEAAKTNNGGWTKEQLEQWGVPWPPKKGWKNKLLERNKIMSKYDNTNKGAAWQPWPDQKFILSGKMDLKGNERKIVMITGKTQKGVNIIEVYQRCSIMFEDTEASNGKPNFSGPLDDYTMKETISKMRMAGWVKEHDDAEMISFEISESTGGTKDDKIPF